MQGGGPARMSGTQFRVGSKGNQSLTAKEGAGLHLLMQHLPEHLHSSGGIGVAGRQTPAHGGIFRLSA